MRLMWYDFDVMWVAGKNLVTADASFRAPLSNSDNANCELVNLVECHIDAVEQAFPSSDEKIALIHKATDEDEVCTEIVDFCWKGWPNLIGYFRERDNIAFKNGLLLMGSRLIISAALQKHMLDKIHTGDQGINKCRERAQFSVSIFNFLKLFFQISIFFKINFQISIFWNWNTKHYFIITKFLFLWALHRRWSLSRNNAFKLKKINWNQIYSHQIYQNASWIYFICFSLTCIINVRKMVYFPQN